MRLCYSWNLILLEITAKVYDRAPNPPFPHRQPVTYPFKSQIWSLSWLPLLCYPEFLTHLIYFQTSNHIALVHSPIFLKGWISYPPGWWVPSETRKTVMQIVPWDLLLTTEKYQLIWKYLGEGQTQRKVPLRRISPHQPSLVPEIITRGIFKGDSVDRSLSNTNIKLVKIYIFFNKIKCSWR